MSWMIGRAAAMSNPEAARRKALAKLQALVELDDPESVVVPILIDALLMVESYRGARHQIIHARIDRDIEALLRHSTSRRQDGRKIAASALASSCWRHVQPICSNAQARRLDR